MPKVHVPISFPIAIRRRPGAAVSIVNDSASDIVVDTNINVLLAAVTGTQSDGKVIASGDSYEWTSFPDCGVVWARAVTAAVDVKVEP